MSPPKADKERRTSDHDLIKKVSMPTAVHSYYNVYAYHTP